ncbi:Conserved hypothetical protein [gamma proteobacterium HdN1]|nr:Conserved hypothetical protein [gamma proteobacterium HdN1]
MDEPVNVLGAPLQPCSRAPLTGFFRDGCCNTSAYDFGVHTICCVMTKEFLQYSRFRGNDLSTPQPEIEFFGLKEGDRWCLSAARWLEAANFGMAPKVVLNATHQRSLTVVSLELLLQHALEEGATDLPPASSERLV